MTAVMRAILIGYVLLQLALAFVTLMLWPTWDALALSLGIALMQVVTSLFLLPYVKRMPKLSARIGKAYYIGLGVFAALLAAGSLRLPAAVGKLILNSLVGLSTALFVMMLAWLMALALTNTNTDAG